MHLFLKLNKMITVNKDNPLHLKDIADIYCIDKKYIGIGNIIVCNLKNKNYGVYSVSALDVVKYVNNRYRDIIITNLGEKETVIVYEKESKTNGRFLNYIKTIIISIILFFGSSSAIISFHYDGEIRKVFDGYYNMFMGENKINNLIEIPYSIGIAGGIIIFFNHFGKSKITTDPTPIEVEMTEYENEVIENMIDNAEGAD